VQGSGCTSVSTSAGLRHQHCSTGKWHSRHGRLVSALLKSSWIYQKWAPIKNPVQYSLVFLGSSWSDALTFLDLFTFPWQNFLLFLHAQFWISMAQRFLSFWRAWNKIGTCLSTGYVICAHRGLIVSCTVQYYQWYINRCPTNHCQSLQRWLHW
jgi:hypothetical protein